MNPFLSMMGGGGISASSSATSGDATSGAGDFTNNAAFSVTGSGSSKQSQGIDSQTLLIGGGILAVAVVLFAALK